MQAIILAAGMGKRLQFLTRHNTKCMVEVNGVKLIDRMLRQLEKYSLDRIVIVVGYEGQKLIDFIETLDIKTPIEYINNPIYDKTNNIYSLSLAKHRLCEDDTLLFESDIIFEDSVIDALLDDPRDTLALVDKYEPWMDGTCVKINENDEIKAFVPGKHFDFSEIDSYYKTVNIYKFSRHFSEVYYVPFLDAYQTALGENEYYEQVLRVITMLDEPAIKAKCLSGQAWYEIDDIQDLDIASSMFSKSDEEKTARLQSRYGGYWRYPKLVDFCYLVNPYFPPKKMLDEIRTNLEKLITQYPSGMGVNSLLAAKNFNVMQENIIVGNGAAELIKSLMSMQSGKTGFVRPTFEEYPNRYTEENSVCFTPQNKDFSYTADDLTEFFADKNISTLVLINPDNPSGNYLKKADVMRLCEWCGARGIKLILDESFADFSDERDNTFIKQDFLSANTHVYVMKSISKSYGVPGLRLGVLASGDTDAIARMKKDVAIWNINSIAEFYMQIEEKYRKDYSASLEKLRIERGRLFDALNAIPYLRPIPSQANYIMAELTDGTTARELTKKLLAEHLLIKDLSRKTGGEYIRIAVRDAKDNQKLINAMTGIEK